MNPQATDYKRLECSDNFPGPPKPFFKFSPGVDLNFLFGAIRYRAIGSVAMLNVFRWRPYARVGSVKCICGFKFGHDKAGE
jgi:hypothetical protein